MSAAVDARGRALAIVREQLGEAARARKCHSCGCFHQTVAALEGTDVARELAADLEAARRTLTAEKYDCLGCPVCYPAVAANAFADAFPAAATGLDLCPTELPSQRAGWPPLAGDYHALRYAAPVAVCTLDDTALSARLAAERPAGLAIVGTMHTENLGIERLISNIRANPHIRRLVLCGADTEQMVGHLPGQSMLSLFELGVADDGRIRGARGKRPVLKNVSREEIEAFRRQVEVVAAIGERDATHVSALIRAAAACAPGAFEDVPSTTTIERVAAAEPRRLVPDPAGYFIVYPDARRGTILLEHITNAGVLTVVFEGKTPAALYAAAIERGLITRLDHAAYLGRELSRAERSLETGEPYVQDRAAGVIEEEPPVQACDCGHPCEGTK